MTQNQDKKEPRFGIDHCNFLYSEFQELHNMNHLVEDTSNRLAVRFLQHYESNRFQFEQSFAQYGKGNS